jgi:shikimate dehydrogenase
MVSSRTKLIALLGTPLSFTMAPTMHNEAFDSKGLDYFYFPIECDADTLPAMLPAFRCMNFAGFSVTKPLKIEIMKHLDEISSLASKIGSVNTIKVEDGKLVGYNTDGFGFAQSLLNTYGNYRGKTMFMVGAGGAARASCFECAERGIRKIYLCSRHESFLAAELSEKANIETEWVCQGSSEVASLIEQSDLLVNASGVGMVPHLGETPIDSSLLRPDLFVADLAYNPAKTRLLEEAEKLGCRIMNGLEMCVLQGARQFNIWTNTSAPTDQMTQTLTRLLSSIK